MNYDKHRIIKRIRDLGYKDSLFMIVGIRSKADKPNEFDDRLYLITPSKFLSFQATTNPGTDWLQTFLNPKGSAVLKPGVYSYKLGLHKGEYEALVQAAPVTVYRDADKDLKSEEEGVLDTGYFGINIHRASKWSLSKLIGKYSAGCQVIANPNDFNILIEECKKSNLTTFPYILLNEW